MSVTELREALEAEVDAVSVSIEDGRSSVARSIRRNSMRRGAMLAAVVLLILGAAGLARSAAIDGATTAATPADRGATAPHDPHAAGRAGKILVFLQLDATGEQIAAIERRLVSHPGTLTVTFTNSDAAFQEFRSLFPDQAEDGTRKVRPADLPQSFRVTPASPSEIPSIAASVRDMPGVLEIICDRDTRCTSPSP